MMALMGAILYCDECFLALSQQGSILLYPPGLRNKI